MYKYIKQLKHMCEEKSKTFDNKTCLIIKSEYKA